MSGHGWVTPNPDGSKARCGGPGLCPACSAEAITAKPYVEVTAVSGTAHEIGQWVAAEAGVSHAAAGLKLIESQPYIGAPVHYVSYGTPGGEYGKECRAAWVTELTEVEVNEQNPTGDGIFRQTVGLMVANPTGLFWPRGVLYVPGTFRDPAREATPGEPMPIVTCADLTFPGGTWHWAAHS
jgi:hypothetical protein